MAVATLNTHARYRTRPTLRQRAQSVALTVAIVGLLLLMLLRLGVLPSMPDRGGGNTTMFAIEPSTSKETGEKQSPAPRDQQHRARRASNPVKAPPTPPTQPPPTTILPPRPQWPGIMMRLSRDQFAKSDIARLPSHSADVALASNGDSDSDSGNGAGDSAVASGSGGPHGETLYKAEWYREPTNAELSTYLRDRRGYGTIACRTIARYHVDDCQALGETPGSGLSYAVQQAAWQFLVRPPRVNGKPVIGAWVSIRITNEVHIVRRSSSGGAPSRDDDEPPARGEAPPASDDWSLPKGDGKTPQSQVYGPH